MTCDRFAPLLSRYHDRVLDDTQRAAVRAHLQTCQSCASRLESYERVDSRVSEALAITAGPAFRRQVLAATVHGREVAGALQTRPGARRRGQLFYGGLAGASVAALIVMVFAMTTSLTVRQLHQPSAAMPAAHDSATAPRLQRVSAFAGPSPTGHPALAPAATVAASRLQPATRPHVDVAARVRITQDLRLTSGAVASLLWSPDSKSLLYLTGWGVHCRDDWYCGTLRLWTGHGTITLAGQVRRFTWSPDGRSVAYTAEAPVARSAGEPQDLHVVRTNGTADRVVAQVDRTNIEWLKAGVMVAQHGTMVVVNPTSGVVTRLAGLPALTVADDSEGFVALSQNERFFAYQDGSGLRIWDRARGGALVLSQALTRLSESSFHFSWDGNTVFYSEYDNRYTRLYRRQLAPLGPATALNDGQPLRGPITLVGAPSADNSIVSFRIGSGATAQNYVIDAFRGKAHLLLPPTGIGPVGWWSPDGLHLVYTVYRGDQGIYTAIAHVSQR